MQVTFVQCVVIFVVEELHNGNGKFIVLYPHKIICKMIYSLKFSLNYVYIQKLAALMHNNIAVQQITHIDMSIASYVHTSYVC